MNLLVNPTITGFRQEVDGTIKELKLGEAKEDAYENIIEQGGKKLDNNKTATINVSTYTEPVVINPTSGKDGMKKATITLSNIPSPSGDNTIYGYHGTIEISERPTDVYFISFSASLENFSVGDKVLLSDSPTEISGTFSCTAVGESNLTFTQDDSGEQDPYVMTVSKSATYTVSYTFD